MCKNCSSTGQHEWAMMQGSIQYSRRQASSIHLLPACCNSACLPLPRLLCCASTQAGTQAGKQALLASWTDTVFKLHMFPIPSLAKSLSTSLPGGLVIVSLMMWQRIPSFVPDNDNQAVDDNLNQLLHVWTTRAQVVHWSPIVRSMEVSCVISLLIKDSSCERQGHKLYSDHQHWRTSWIS